MRDEHERKLDHHLSGTESAPISKTTREDKTLAQDYTYAPTARGPHLLKNLTYGPWEDLKYLANDDG